MHKILFCIGVFFIQECAAQQYADLKYTFNKQNVVASAIEGKWFVEGLNITISFVKDTTALDSIPFKYQQFFGDKLIYFAGVMRIEKPNKVEIVAPCILISSNGNPHIVYFKDRNGIPLDDSESFNLFIAKGATPTKDILYIGGDFNNQAFKPAKRIN